MRALSGRANTVFTLGPYSARHISTLNRADRIVLVRDGRIFAAGSGNELIRRAGRHKASQDGRDPDGADLVTNRSDFEHAISYLLRDSGLP